MDDALAGTVSDSNLYQNVERTYKKLVMRIQPLILDNDWYILL